MKAITPIFTSVALMVALSGCNADTADTAEKAPEKQAPEKQAPAQQMSTEKVTQAGIINLSSFNKKALLKEPEVVDCTLENGTESKCAKLVVKYLPDDLEIGPFCPQTLKDASGIWNWSGENGGLYSVNESFFKMLDSLGYSFYDEDGTVHVADLAVAGPVDDHACLNVSADKSVEITVLIPVNPSKAEKSESLGTVSKIGLAMNGTPIFSDAPTIPDTGHMPVLDTCGGHIDPGGWYHWHATTTDLKSIYEAKKIDAGCSLTQDPSALFGYAFDGFPMYGSTDADGVKPADLDQCGGHIGETKEHSESIYHYHSSLDFPNLPTCLVGVQAKNNFSTTAQTGVGSSGSGDGPGRGGPGGQRGAPPGFAKAAKELGVTERDFMKAIEGAGGRQLDFEKAAKALNVTEEKLRAVLPPPPNR